MEKGAPVALQELTVTMSEASVSSSEIEEHIDNQEDNKMNKQEDSKMDKQEDNIMDKQEDSKMNKQEDNKMDKKEDNKMDKKEDNKMDKQAVKQIDKIPSETAGCLLHSRHHRARFQQVLNLVRDKIVPAHHVFRLNSLVCVCKNSDEKSALDALIDKLGKDIITTSLQGALKERDVKLEKALEFYLNSRKKHSKESADRSSLRLFILLKQALAEDFTLYNLPLLQIAGDGQDIDLYVFKETLVLPMPTTWIGLLFGLKGHNIKPLCKQHEVTVSVPTVDYGYWNGNRIPDAAKISVVIKAKSSKGLAAMASELSSAAKRISDNRTVHEKRTKDYLERQIARRRRNQSEKNRRHRKAPRRTHFGNGGVSFVAYEKKAMDRMNYSKKYLHDQRKGDVRQWEKQRPQVLEQGSRCGLCLQPYDREANNTGPDPSCKFHTGYIKQPSKAGASTWSCCSESIKDTSVAGQLESHKLNGCKEGQRHIWRMHRKNPVRKTGYDAERGMGRTRKCGRDTYNVWLDV